MAAVAGCAGQVPLVRHTSRFTGVVAPSAPVSPRNDLVTQPWATVP